MAQNNTLKKISILGIFMFFLQIFFIYESLYAKIWWLDIFMHILGGIWVAFIFFYWFFERDGFLHKKNGFWPNLILCLSFVALIGVLWEFYEFFFDYFVLTQHQQSLADTMKDLFNDLSGGFLVSIYYLLKK